MEVKCAERKSKPVARIEHGKMVESARQAAIAHGLVSTSVAKSARTGCKAGGMNWTYI